MNVKGLVVGSILGALALVAGCSAVGFNNDCVRAETDIEAQYKKNQNTYSDYFNTIKELSQVPEMYAKDLKDVYTAAIQGRYGDKGAQQMILFVKEHNPNLDPAMYNRIQVAIQSGRSQFKKEQDTLLDKKRVYEQTLHTFPGSMYAGVLGFPKKDLEKMDIVIDDTTAKTFETKRQDPIKLR